MRDRLSISSSILEVGGPEPSNQTVIRNFEKVEDVLGMAKQFQESAYQQAVMVRTNSVEQGTKIGHLYDDGSYNTSAYSLPMASLDKSKIDEAQKIASEVGLAGFNVNPDTGSLEFYYTGGGGNVDAVAEWERAAGEFIRRSVESGLLKAGSANPGANRISGKLHRLYVVDDGFGRDRSGDRFGSAGKGPVPGARALATLARAKLNPTLSPEIDWGRLSNKPIDKAFHERAALAHDAMADNNLVDPVVREAYEALRRDVDLQASYSPYEYRFSDVQYGNSDLMRADVTNTGRMNVYKTEPGSFGPEGIDIPCQRLLGTTPHDRQAVP